MNSEYKHVVEKTKKFDRALKNIDKKFREELFRKVDELAKGLRNGKRLHGPFKEFKVLRVGPYRLFFREPESCRIVLYDVKHRETAYQ